MSTDAPIHRLYASIAHVARRGQQAGGVGDCPADYNLGGVLSLSWLLDESEELCSQLRRSL